VSARRFLTVFRGDVSQLHKRPIFWVLLLILGLTAWGLAGGNMRIASGESEVGGTKAWLTSEFSQAQMLSMVIFIFYMFFIAIASGMAVIRDQEQRVGEILHSTPLTPGEYLWGKFWAVVTGFGVILLLHVLLTIFFNQVFPNAHAEDIRGPFHLVNYARPAVMFGLAGTSFAIGTLTRKPILVFIIPVAALLGCAFFLWEWSPSWLDPRVNRALMLVEPSGFRWINETWLKVDRGVDFYNTAPMTFDLPFLLSRAGFVALGLGAVAWTRFRFARSLRGSSRRGKARRPIPIAAETEGPRTALRPLSALGMTSSAVGLFRGAFLVARHEFKELIKSPGLYLFVPLIITQVIGNAHFAIGSFDTPILLTSGYLAVSSMGTITLLVCLLLLFYTVESLVRERTTGLGQILYATPVRSASLLLGKAFANTTVAAAIILAAFLASVIMLLIQGKVGIDPFPFLLVWGLLLLPTFLAWSAFVMAVQAVSGNRYLTYAFGLGALSLTGYKQMTGKMTWVWNWDIWNTLNWSDFGVFELNRFPLLLNRLLVLSLIGFLVALTVRTFDRRGRDLTRALHRLRPRPLLGNAFALFLFLIPSLALGSYLYVQVDRGFQGKKAEKAAKDYWRANIATWVDAPLPAMRAADVTLDLDPAHRRLKVEGTYEMMNHEDEPLARIPLTLGTDWDTLSWTMNGEEYEPDNRSGLYVFEPDGSLEPGDIVTIGWKGERRFPRGATKNGGGVMEYLLPMGAVLTSFSGAFSPTLGFDETIGVDEKNRHDPKKYPKDHWKGPTHAGVGSDFPFQTRVTVSAPEEYTINSVGKLVDERVADGRRTVRWESDHPVNFFNVVAGRWDVRKGDHTAIYYLPQHTYNLDEMIEALDGARKYYSEWFYPYPWQELKLSEFANLARYAQGFPTNITFSEGIGFLTKSDPRVNLAFMVTAHESAHQWWGNLLMPGKGPGGDILSEGMAHFSTILLFDQMKGPQQRIEFTKRIESKYGDDRQADSERPLNLIDGQKPGDKTVTYDKGGMVFWMLYQHMGRERALAGYRDLIRRFSDGSDHALIEDLVAVMREHAENKQAFDEFANQWFFDVVVPEYKFHDVTRTRISGEGDDALWEVTGRIENAGTGRMPVEVAAMTGERFPKETEEEPKDGEAASDLASLGPATAAASAEDTGDDAKAFHEARTTVTLGAGESAEFTIRCSFQPDRVLEDPDVLVLQLNRKMAIHRF